MAHDSIQLPDSLVLGTLNFTGTKITKHQILQREMTVQTGVRYESKYLMEQLQRSRQNMMNMALFNFVDLNTSVAADTVYVEYHCTERWYLWPSPIFEYVDPNLNTWLKTKDISRTSYGFLVTQYNFRGRNETIRLRLKFGYNRQYSLSYEIPYIDKHRKLGLAFYGAYYQNYQVNTATEDNKRIFYTIPGGVAREESSVSARLQFRPKTFDRHFLVAKMNQIHIQDSLRRAFPDYLGDSISHRKFLEFVYTYSYDKRDYSAYPLKGIYYTFSVSKPDINLGKGVSPNLWQFYAQVKKYYTIKKGYYFAYSLSGKATAYKQLPYYFQRGLGYSDFVRGYEYYIFDAQHYAILKSSFKIRLLEPTEFHIPFIRNKKYSRIFFAGYLNFNADMGYAADRLYADKNPLSNKLLMGGGTGLDLISFYDVVMRVEYSVNRKGESGFFFHFARPI